MSLPLRDRTEPPEEPLLRALWHGLRGEWAAAHALAQADPGPHGAWVHGWLHRIEGDLANAGYWYHRAGRAPGRGTTAAEGEAIARALGA
ncbi:hypothetical protein [Falsiroseomonas selenitidurans]|uniref:Uncharacterized protein n=1 Tax=Falsiroseomonas selenitidurans TaxID=2716335 RepID=A0ABX1ECG6_9PROT|nr:hypothetical protein [Falsiroseomonas selenitidurans]NKC33582.1 hypothetical protein [Falsiroseomonas selenitidurans]